MTLSDYKKTQPDRYLIHGFITLPVQISVTAFNVSDAFVHAYKVLNKHDLQQFEMDILMKDGKQPILVGDTFVSVEWSSFSLKR